MLLRARSSLISQVVILLKNARRVYKIRENIATPEYRVEKY